MSPLDTLLSTVVVAIWGVNFVFMKLGTTELPPFLLSTMRFCLVAAMIVPFRPLPRRRWPLVLALAVVLGVGHFGLLLCAASGLDAASTAIGIQLCVPFSAMVGAMVYRERLGRAGWIGLILGMTGVVLLAGEPTHPSPPHLLLVAAAAMAWAWSNVLVKRIGPIDSLTLNGWTALFSIPPLAAMSLAFEHGQVEAVATAGWHGWSALAFTAGASSLIAYTLWYRLIARNPMNRVVPFTLLGPVIGVISGALLLSEPLHWLKLLGGALTILGVAVVQFRPSIKGTATT
ncbi:MAG TPA: EamA family transporter [Candidatus Sulfotelmatobacter sp.]|jgi:O-acetylserine/cysteine efflux transporter|nr:EamA family transporter [Candidatus Sulfotelmatobacter sp.]